MSDPAESTISTSLRLTKALGLARQGKLKAAELLLAPEGATPGNTTELHALAALVTHEGDYPRALRLWRSLLQRQPDHPEARRMIPMIELWQSRPAWHRFVPLGAGTAATILLCAILFWAFGGAGSSSTPAVKPATAPAPAPAQIAPVTPSPAPAPIKIAPFKTPTPKSQRRR